MKQAGCAGVLRIVPLYQGMARYVSAAKASPGVERQILWEQHVVDPYWAQWGAGQHNEAQARAEIGRPIADLDGLQEIVTALSGSGVEELVRGAYARICELLPYHDGETAVCIAAADPQDHGLAVRLNGVVGGCAGANTLLTIHPAAADWQE